MSYEIALVFGVFALMQMSCVHGPGSRPPSPVEAFGIHSLIGSDDFTSDNSRWVSELENGGVVRAANGTLEIDSPGGCSVWFKPVIDGPVMIEYDAMVVVGIGPNDRLSDLNCFWMATDARSPDDLFATKRSGKFADYNQLRAYYVGSGGNSNTTTRFRRYIGDKELRPLFPEHDLKDKGDLLEANKTYHIRLIAARNLIQFYRDDRKVFEYNDPQPYTRGHFAFRTVNSHLKIKNFRVYQMTSK